MRIFAILRNLSATGFTNSFFWSNYLKTKLLTDSDQLCNGSAMMGEGMSMQFNKHAWYLATSEKMVSQLGELFEDESSH